MIELSDLTGAVAAKVTSTGSTQFESATIDSRGAVDGALFFALKGARDGHDFARAAALAGVTGLVLERPVPGLPEGLTVVEVSDTLSALQGMAACARQRASAAVIAITGSAGKTTTKDMTSRVLASRLKVHSSKDSFNNHLGLPLTLLGVSEETTHVVAEIGTNHRGEIQRLAEIAAPDVGIVTNVGFAHIGNFRDRSELAEEKTDLLRSVRTGGTWIVNGDDELLRKAMAQIPRSEVDIVSVGFDQGNSLRVEHVEYTEAGTTGRVVVDDRSTHFHLPVVGRPFVYAALFALAVGRRYGIAVEDGIEALSETAAPRGRAEVKKIPNGPVIVDDSYNASPDAMLAALELLGGMPATMRIAVLGEMRELGAMSDHLHGVVGEKAATSATHVIVVGKGAERMLDGARRAGMPQERGWQTESALQASKIASQLASASGGAETVILAKGSRFTHMERVPLVLAGRSVGCALAHCSLYINCETCSRLEGE